MHIAHTKYTALNSYCNDAKCLWFPTVTEDELTHGMFKLADPQEHCLCYIREIESLHNHLFDNAVSQYIDINPKDPTQVNAKSQQLLHNLKNEKIPACLGSENIRMYSLPWVAGGISPQNTEHAKYLGQFCQHVFTDLKLLIDRALSTRIPQCISTQDLYLEVLQHANFCVNRCETFCGQENLLSKILAHFTAEQGMPLVVYGESGSGKTSVMAKVATILKSQLGPSCKIVLRFLGTSPCSSSICDVLASVCLQICTVYNVQPPNFIQMDTTKVIQYFRNQLIESLCLSPTESLVIILDSIDQLSTADGAHSMNWLPKMLPIGVRIIISMLPQEFNCLATIQSILPSEECYIRVDAMPVSTGIDILTAWLKKEKRRITLDQQEVVSKAFSRCPQPLFMKLVFQQAMQWKSYTPPQSIKLASSTATALSQLFEQVEEQHGIKLVQHTLAYLTAAKNGLTEVELEDILSLDDEVLDDVYQYWDPPVEGIVRIPPLLWKRIKHTINTYLVRRQADGKGVQAWYHRQFIETARKRYLGREIERKLYHMMIATYFEGTWSEGKTKPVSLTHRQLWIEEADRQVAPQPLEFSPGVHNFRKLSELPYHLSLSSQVEKLKQQVLCNFDWQLSKLLATSYTNLKQDFIFALSLFSDEMIATLSETLSLAASNLQADPTSLAGQLLGRLSHVTETNTSKYLNLLLDAAKTWCHASESCQMCPKYSCLISPGGPLKTTLSGHSQLIQHLGISTSHRLAVSASKGQESSIFNVWDLTSLDCVQNLHTIKIIGKGVPQLALSQGLAAGSCDCIVKVWSMRTGEVLQSHQISEKVTALLISKDACTVITATESGSVILWSRISGKSTPPFKVHNAAVKMLCFGSDEQCLVSGSQEGEVCVSILSPVLECIHHFQAHTKAVTSLATALIEKCTMAVTGSEDGVVNVLEICSGRYLHALSGHKKAVKCLQVTSLENYSNPLAISGSLDKTLKVWDIKSGSCLQTLNGHADGVWCMAVLGNDLIVSGSKDDYLKVWDLNSGNCLYTLEGHSSWISCVGTLGEDIVVSGSNDKHLKIWQLKEATFSQHDRHITQPECIAATNHTSHIVSGAPDGIKVWSAIDGTCLHTWSTSASVLATNSTNLLVSGDKNSIITTWDLTTFNKLQTLEGHTGAVSCLHVVNSYQLISGSADSTLKIWNLKIGTCVQTLSGHKYGIKCLSVSKDGCFAASGSHDFSIRVWHIPTAKCTCTLTGHNKVVWCIAISDNNNLLISGSDDCTMCVWNLQNMSLIHTIRYTDSIKCLAITSDNSLVVAGAHCGQYQLRSWSTQTGKCLSTYQGHTHAVMCLLLFHNDEYLITGSRDGTVKLWNLFSATLLASFDLQSQVKYLALISSTHENSATLAATTKSGLIAIFELQFPNHLLM